MKHLIAAAVFVLTALPGWATEDIVKVKSANDVATTMDALETAVTGAGATVFARIDHAGGAMSAGMELSDRPTPDFRQSQAGDTGDAG